MSITPSKQTSVYRQVDAILKTEDIYGGRQVRMYIIGSNYRITCMQASNVTNRVIFFVVSEPNPLRPLRDLQYVLGEAVFDGCRHLEYMNIWSFNEPKYYFVCLRQEAQMVFFYVFLLRFLSKVVLDIRNHSI